MPEPGMWWNLDIFGKFAEIGWQKSDGIFGHGAKGVKRRSLSGGAGVRCAPRGIGILRGLGDSWKSLKFKKWVFHKYQ